tara:strand:+ start:341 stop:1567 length:1227 start_codon:yes stop_codon:yes gene_type:complete
MARRELVNTIVQLYKKLGGNTNDVLGTKTNVNFLGKGKSPELMLDMDINEEALAILPQSKAVEELTGSVGYAVAGKLNDIQANKLLSNMKKMEKVYFPPAEPKNVVDLATRTGGLDKAGLMSLRAADDLPPPGSRGGPDDIAAPTQSADETFRNMARAEGIDKSPTGAGLESIKNVQNNNLIVNELVDTIYLNAGVTKNAQPTVRANARDFLNRVKDLEDPQFPGGPTLSSVMEADDFRFMTEGGGAGLGDPLLLVQKYFGPKVATAIAKIDNPNDIQKFAERLIRVKDGRGRSVTDRMFDPRTVNPEDFEFADGGRVPMFMGGAARMGFQALRKYGFEGKDISRLFAGLGTDKKLVGKEKTMYFKQLNKVLKNPDDYPDAIKDLQKQLGIEVGIGFRSGGLAKILEV